MALLSRRGSGADPYGAVMSTIIAKDGARLYKDWGRG